MVATPGRWTALAELADFSHDIPAGGPRACKNAVLRRIVRPLAARPCGLSNPVES